MVRRQSIEPKPLRWALVALVAAAVAWQFRGVLGGGVFAFEDVTAYFLPLYTALGRALRHHEMPWWELGAWSGQPLLGDPQLAAFYPPHWLCAWVAPVRLYAWLALTHTALAATGMWRLVRARGGSAPASALAAIALSGSAFYVLEVRHAMFGASTAWLIWSWWALERWSNDRQTSSLLWLALFGALALLAGGWSLLYYGASVAVVLASAAVARGEHRAINGARVSGAALLGVTVAAVALVPALVHAHYSPRSLGLTYKEAASYAWPSWRYLVTLVQPTYFGDDARGTYLGAPDQWEVAGWSVGLTAALLVPFSFLRRARRGERIALFILCLGAIGLARGEGFFLHPLLYRLSSLFASLRCPARALYIWTLVIPLLAADGMDELRVRWPRLAPLLMVIPAIAAVELAVTWRAENPTVSVAATQTRIPAVDALRFHKGVGRATNDVHLPQPFHNGGMRWGYESAGGYSSIPIWRYLHYLWIANHGAVFPSPKIDRDLTAQGLWNFSSRLVDLLNVQYVISDRDHPLDVGPHGAPYYRRVFVGPDGIDLWKNEHALPRAFVVYRAHVTADDSQAARALADARFLPDRVAIVEQPVEVPAADVNGKGGDGKDAPAFTPVSGFFRVGPSDVAMEVTTKSPGILVVSEVDYPGWTATVDGVDAPILRVDYALRGVPLLPGRHVVAMTFVDLSTAYGAAASTTACVLLLLLALRQRWLRQSSRAGVK